MRRWAFALWALALLVAAAPLAHAGWSQSGGGQAGTGGFACGGDINGTGCTANAPTISGLTGTGNGTVTYVGTLSAPTLTQASESSATKGADMLIQPQQSTHPTDQGGGNLLVNLQTPAGAGSHAFLTVQENGVNEVSVGTVAANVGYIFFGPGTPSTTNYNLAGSLGGTTYVGSGALQVVATGTVQVGTGPLLSGVNTQLGSTTAAFGGGTGVVGIANASVVPTSNPSGGGVVYESGGGLYHRGSGGAISQTAATGVGTQNSQDGKLYDGELYWIETTSSTAATYATIAVPSSHCMTLQSMWNVRVKNSGSGAASNVNTCVACNSAGVVSVSSSNTYASNVAVGAALCTSGTPAVACTNSGGNVLLQVSGCTNASSNDWQIFVTTSDN